MSNTDAPELLPCPFCGSGNVFTTEEEGSILVACGDCEAGGPDDGYLTGRQAITAWNTRATRQQAEAVGAMAEAAAWPVLCAAVDCTDVEYEDGLRRLAKMIHELTPSEATAALEARDARVWDAAIEAADAVYSFPDGGASRSYNAGVRDAIEAIRAARKGTPDA